MKTGVPKGTLAICFFCLVFLPITFSLGMWQMNRAQEKEQLLVNMETQSAQAAKALNSGFTELEMFRPYLASGAYLNKNFLLDNRVREGKVGYEVLTPLILNASGLVLVNRGWVAASPYRQDLPDLDTPEGEVTVAGSFYAPDAPLPVLKQVSEKLEWPLRIQSIDWQKLEQLLGRSFISRQEFRLLDNAQSGAYQTGWPKTRVMPEKHLAYAYQWFAMSLALAVLTVFALYHNYKSSK